MARSNFKVFAEAVAALNVVSDAEYATDTQRINGVVPGLASAALHNKLYKQATIMAAALAQPGQSGRAVGWVMSGLLLGILLARSVADIKNTRMNLRSAARPNRGQK